MKLTLKRQTLRHVSIPEVQIAAQLGDPPATGKRLNSCGRCQITKPTTW